MTRYQDFLSLQCLGGSENDISVEQKLEGKIFYLRIKVIGATSIKITYKKCVEFKIFLACSANLSLMEVYALDVECLNMVTEKTIVLNKGAVLSHEVVSDALTTIRSIFLVSVHDHGSFLSSQKSLENDHVITSDSLDMQIDLLGEGSSTRIRGAFFSKHKQVLVRKVAVRHLASHTSSLVEYRSIVDDTAQNLYNVSCEVSKETRKTKAVQKIYSMCLSDGVYVEAAPFLSILSSDTITQHQFRTNIIDKSVLLYFNSRCIDNETAKKLLKTIFISLYEE